MTFRTRHVAALLALCALGLVAFILLSPRDARPEGNQDGYFAGVPLKIEYATTTQAREQGLSGRANVPADYGMLFVFPASGRYGFWMKDMRVPLDMFWLDERKKVVFVLRDVSPSTYPQVFYPPSPARYVLETATGFAKRHGVATGTPLTLPKDSGW